MKLGILNNKEKKEKVVKLGLEMGEGDVILRAYDSEGLPEPSGHIIKITKSGELVPYSWISPHIGFNLDGNGKITIV